MKTAAAGDAIAVGTVLAETYEVTRLLGKGGMGAVWEAKHLRLQDKRVAIKVLLSEVAGNAESVIRFKREANIASQLGHANIIEVYDIKELPDGSHYIVLEYLEGEDLAARMVHGAISPDHALPIVRQVCSALQAAHEKGIVHRDLKPGNIMLVPTEFAGYATEVAKVLDFGISKMQDSATLKTQTATVLGTPQYMAPEQALGEHGKVDARTDIFAMGCIVYEMLSGQMAFQGSAIPEIMFKIVYQEPVPLNEVAPHLAPEICAAVHRALAKDQNHRFANMSEFVEALTGDPLTTIRGAKPVLEPASKPPPSMADRPRSGEEAALAATLATAQVSGDRPYMQNPFPATGEPRGQDSAGHPAQPMIQTAQPVVHTAQPQGGKGSRSLVPIFGFVFVAVAAAVAVTLFLTKGGDSDESASSDGTTVAQNGTPGANPADNPADNPNSPDTTGDKPDGPGGTRPGDNGTTPIDPGGKKPGGDKPGDKPGGDKPGGDKPGGKKPGGKKPSKKDPVEKLDPKAAEHLAQAKKLYRDKKYAKAVRRAQRSIGVQDSQKARELVTRSYCAMGNIGLAVASGRKLRASTKKRLKPFCKKNGVTLE